MLSRRILALLGLLGLTLAVIGPGLAQWVWHRLAVGLGPAQRTVAGVAATGSEEAPANEELAALRAEVAMLRRRVADAEELRSGGGPTWKTVARGKVLARTLRSGRRYLDLDVGISDGVMGGMAVCAGRSLVGVVAGVTDTRCTVQLIGDGESRIAAALVNPRPGQPTVLSEGVLAGGGRRNEVSLLLVEDREGLEIPLGTSVVTVAGLNRVPAGLVLGEVVSALRPGRSDTQARTALSPDHWNIRVRTLRPIETCQELVVVDAFVRR